MKNDLEKHPQFETVKPVTDPNVVGHLISLINYPSIYCKNFYTLNNFFCIENAKIEKVVKSTIEMVEEIYCNTLSYGFQVYRNNINYNYNYRKDSYRKTSSYGKEIFCMTVPVTSFIEVGSYKENQIDFPSWTLTTKNEAIENANKLEEKENQSTIKRNEEYVETIYEKYKDWIASIEYNKKSNFYKRFHSDEDKWKSEWLKNNDVNTEPLDSKLSIFLITQSELSFVINTMDIILQSS